MSVTEGAFDLLTLADGSLKNTRQSPVRDLMKRTYFLACMLILTVDLLGCATVLGVDPGNAHEVNDEVTVNWDPFKNLTVYRGPIFTNTFEGAVAGPEVEELSLSAQRNPGRPDRFFVTLSDYYDGDWRGFDQAFDLEGHKFHALSVRHDVHCHLICGYEETIEIELTREYLEAHRQSGMTMRLYGPSKAASAPFAMPGSYIQGFLEGSYSAPGLGAAEASRGADKGERK